jgi:ABC-type transport system substrate-binding protein
LRATDLERRSFKMGFKVKLGLVAVLALMLGLLVTVTAVPQGGGRVYRMGIHEDMTTTSYMNYMGPGSTVWNAYVLGNMHPSLYGLSDVTFQPILSLAEDYATPIVKEGEFWTSSVCITPGNTWSDGTEITAEDVAFSYNGILELDPIALGGNWPYNVDPDVVDHVDVTGPYCVKFFLKVKPGLARWEYGTLEAPILQKAFWGPKFEAALASADPVATIYADPGQPEPSGTSWVFKHWEPGAYAEIERSYTNAPKETEGMSRLFEYESGFYASGSVSSALGGYRASMYFVAATDEEYQALKASLTSLGDTFLCALCILRGCNCIKTQDILICICTNDANRSVKIRSDVYDASKISALWKFVDDTMKAVQASVPGKVTLDFAPGPYVDSVVYKLYGTLSAGALALIAGEIDFQLNPLGYELGLRRQLEAAPGVTVFSNPDNGIFYFSFNLRRPPMNNLYFRKALDCMIDREYVCGELLQGVCLAAYSVVPEGNAFWFRPPSEEEKEARCIGFSAADKLKKAVEYLKMGGFTWQVEPEVLPDGTIKAGRGIMLDGQLVPEIEMIHPNAAYDNRRNIFGLQIAKAANTLGIPLRNVPTGFNVIVSRVFDEQDFDMWSLGWSLTIYPDYLEGFFHSQYAELGGQNPQGYSNPEYDALAEAFVLEQDINKARELAFKLQEFLAKDLPYVPLFYAPTYEAYRSDYIQFPYTQVLAGISDLNGMISYVKLIR